MNDNEVTIITGKFNWDIGKRIMNNVKIWLVDLKVTIWLSRTTKQTWPQRAMTFITMATTRARTHVLRARLATITEPKPNQNLMKHMFEYSATCCVMI